MNSLGRLCRCVSSQWRFLAPQVAKATQRPLASLTTGVAPRNIIPQDNKFEGQETVEDISVVREQIVSQVNNQILKGEEGRLFAVVHVAGKQFKVTSEDVIIIEGYWPPTIGDQIKFEKVMLVGGKDFTLVGRPILPQSLVTVRGTIVEKDLSHSKPIFYKKKRKQYMRLNFYRSQWTMVRINEVNVRGKVDEHGTVESYERTM